MTPVEVRSRVKRFYLEQNFELQADSHKLLKFGHADAENAFLIEESDLTLLSEKMAEVEKYQFSPNECSILGEGYREQVIENTELFSILDRSQDEIYFGNPLSESLFLSVGRASPLFVAAMTISKEYSARLLGEMRYSKYANPVRHLKYRNTIKVYNLSKIRPHDAISASENAIKTALFDLSYLKYAAYEPSTKWERKGIGPIWQRQASAESQFSFKSVKYNEDLVRFYKRGIAAYDPFIQFMSFYSICEYFFVRVSDALLYKRLSSIYNDPRFSSSPTHLDRVIQSVQDHRKDSDETSMLRAVLEEYVDEIELIEEISKIDPMGAGNIYTKPNVCFGQALDKITLQKGHTFGPIAKRIKSIRNTLVHSSDRYERKERYVPGPLADEVISREVPLLRYIAERIVISTATPSN